MSKPKVFIIASHFYPGFKAGGPPKSIYNLICALERDFSFSIFTRDRDVDDLFPYPSIPSSEWIEYGRHRIYYANPKEFNAFTILRAMSRSKFDLLYLNSFFGFKHSIIPFIGFLFFNRPFSCLIAPRGEFSPGALNLKSSKKRLYIVVFKFILICFRRAESRLSWHATSSDEKILIVKTLGVLPSDVHVASNLPSFQTPSVEKVELQKSSEWLELVFISRISRMKNLDFILRCLQRSTRKIRLTVYGPIRESSYWQECSQLKDRLPANVEFSYEGSLSPEQVPSVFSKHHLFVFPTLGENYGHIIVEALSASVPVLISDQTPWSPSVHSGLAVQSGFDEKTWLDRIEGYCDYDFSQWTKLKLDAFAAWRCIVENDEGLEATRVMLKTSMSK